MMKRINPNAPEEIRKVEVLKDLLSYMRFRFNKEGSFPDQELKIIKDHFKEGIRTFFGVTVDEESGLVKDTENPDALTEYRSLRYPN